MTDGPSYCPPNHRKDRTPDLPTLAHLSPYRGLHQHKPQEIARNPTHDRPVRRELNQHSPHLIPSAGALPHQPPWRSRQWVDV